MPGRQLDAVMVVALMTGIVAACGSPSLTADAATGPPADTRVSDAAGAGAAFLGSWAYATGTTTSTCVGLQPVTDPATGALVITPGPSAESVIATQPGICSLAFNVSGKVATIEPGQTCSVVDRSSERATYDMTNWTLTLSADGQTMDETLSARETVATDGGSVTCSFTERGVTLRRSP
jgi:hypothetical protein